MGDPFTGGLVYLNYYTSTAQRNVMLAGTAGIGIAWGVASFNAEEGAE